MSDLGPGRIAVQLSEWHEAADRTGTVGLVTVDLNALLAGGAGLRDIPFDPSFGLLNRRLLWAEAV